MNFVPGAPPLPRVFAKALVVARPIVRPTDIASVESSESYPAKWLHGTIFSPRSPLSPFYDVFLSNAQFLVAQLCTQVRLLTSVRPLSIMESFCQFSFPDDAEKSGFHAESRVRALFFSSRILSESHF